MRAWWICLLLSIFLGCEAPPPPPEIVVDLSQLAPEAARAIEQQRKEIKLQPLDSKRWHTLGMLYHAHGLEEPAVKAYEYALEQSFDPRTSYLLSIAYARLGLYDAALAAAKLVKQYAPSHWRQGYWLLDLDQLDASSQQFQQALDLDPLDTAAIVGLARVRIAQGKPELAIQRLEFIRSRGGEHPYISFLLGTAHQRAGHREIADRLLRLPISAPPRWVDPWAEEMRQMQRGFSASLSRAMNKIDSGNLSGALSDLQSLSKTNPRNPAVLNNLATVHIQMGNTNRAIEILTQSLRWAPKHAPSQLTMALAYMRQGNLDRAAGYAKKAIELQPAMSTAHALAGQIAFAQRDSEAAKAYLSKAISIGNADTSTREMLAYVMVDLGEHVQAIEQFNLVLQVAPNRISSITGIAIATAKQGNIEGAMRMLSQVRQQYPNNQIVERAMQLVIQMRNSP